MSDYGQRIAHDTVRIERVLPGPIERVWAWLTEPDRRAAWLAGGEMDLRIGGAVELVFRNCELTPGDSAPPPKYAAQSGEVRTHGTITACEPPRVLAYTWGEAEGVPSEVRFELAGEDGAVRLVLTHRRLHGDALLLSVAAGWHAHLDILAARLDDAPPPPFWRHHTRLEADYAERLGLGQFQ